jgi:hypothetical protein
MREAIFYPKVVATGMFPAAMEKALHCNALHFRECHHTNVIQDEHRNPNQRFSGLGFELHQHMFTMRHGAATANAGYAAVVGDPRTCHRNQTKP